MEIDEVFVDDSEDDLKSDPDFINKARSKSKSYQLPVKGRFEVKKDGETVDTHGTTLGPYFPLVENLGTRMIDGKHCGWAGPNRSESSGSDSSEGSDEKKNPGRITVDLPPDLARKAKAAAYYMPGVYLYTLVQEGVRRVIEELEEEMGEELPTDVDQLEGGRPNTFEENNRRWADG